jgi:two-component system chemotaxis sensor kinase CheA
MKKETRAGGVLRAVFLGKRYAGLTSINDQVRYMAMNSIFMVAVIPLVALGISLIGVDFPRTVLDFGLAGLCLICVLLLRSKAPLRVIPVFPVTVFGLYCLYLLSRGTLHLWTAVWIFAFPPVAIFLCRMTVGVIESAALLGGLGLILYAPFFPVPVENDIRIRLLAAYVLVTALIVIYERIGILKDRKERALSGELAHERDLIATMKDNLQQGIFLMDAELKILPQYSKPLAAILSCRDSELAGKNFLGLLTASLDGKQLQTMKGYFGMIFAKSKSMKVLEGANPISEFEYAAEGRKKILSTRFGLIEQAGADPRILGIVQDVTREKEFERDLRARREEQEREMKNLFDVIQIDPLVFQDFIEDTESNFRYINAILKDRSLTGRQVVTKFFQNIHAVKSNALILGLESFGKNLHRLEEEIKAVSAKEEITNDDVLGLAVKLEVLMREKDSYLKMVKRIDAFKTANRVDSVLIHSLTRAVEKVSAETGKPVEFRAACLDMEVLESKLRKPIKDILFQCVRNAIYHGIEPPEERVRKNKKPRGLLSLSIKKTGGKAEVVFSDDGRGLDWGKIKKKYLEIHPGVGGAGPDRKTLLAAIFSPEFSTAGETNLVAGRGVGLSLIKDIVREYHGAIGAASSEAGLVFRFIFPMNG